MFSTPSFFPSEELRKAKAERDWICPSPNKNAYTVRWSNRDQSFPVSDFSNVCLLLSLFVWVFTSFIDLRNVVIVVNNTVITHWQNPDNSKLGWHLILYSLLLFHNIFSSMTSWTMKVPTFFFFKLPSLFFLRAITFILKNNLFFLVFSACFERKPITMWECLTSAVVLPPRIQSSWHMRLSAGVQWRFSQQLYPWQQLGMSTLPFSFQKDMNSYLPGEMPGIKSCAVLIQLVSLQPLNNGLSQVL